MLSDNTIDSDKSSGVPISHQMSTLYLPSNDAHAVATDLNLWTCAIDNDEQSEHILQGQRSWSKHIKIIMSYGLAIGLSFLETRILVWLCTFRVTIGIPLT